MRCPLHNESWVGPAGGTWKTGSVLLVACTAVSSQWSSCLCSFLRKLRSRRHVGSLSWSQGAFPALRSQGCFAAVTVSLFHVLRGLPRVTWEPTARRQVLPICVPSRHLPLGVPCVRFQGWHGATQACRSAAFCISPSDARSRSVVTESGRTGQSRHQHRHGNGRKDGTHSRKPPPRPRCRLRQWNQQTHKLIRRTWLRGGGPRAPLPTASTSKQAPEGGPTWRAPLPGSLHPRSPGGEQTGETPNLLTGSVDAPPSQKAEPCPLRRRAAGEWKVPPQNLKAEHGPPARAAACACAGEARAPCSPQPRRSGAELLPSLRTDP